MGLARKYSGLPQQQPQQAKPKQDMEKKNKEPNTAERTQIKTLPKEIYRLIQNLQIRLVLLLRRMVSTLLLVAGAYRGTSFLNLLGTNMLPCWMQSQNLT